MELEYIVWNVVLLFLINRGDCNPVVNEDTYATVEGEDVDITCTNIDGFFYWMDRSPPAPDNPFYSSRTDTVNGALKYTNFDVVNPDASSSILRITGATCDDSSIYICTLDAANVDEFGDSALLNVSVKPTLAVTAVDSANNIVEGISYQFECTALNAYPAVSLSWEVNGISLSGSETGPDLTTDYKGCDTYDSKSILTYSPNRTDTSVVCISSNQPLSNGLRKPFEIDVKYAPTCKINVLFDNSFNSSGEVICSCDANPTAAYTFYEDNNQVTTGVAGDTYSFDYVVLKESKTTVIYCKGANSVGQDESEAVTITSIPGIVTTEAPPTKGQNKGGGGSSAGLIVGIIFAVILLIVVGVGVAVYCVKIRPAKQGVKSTDHEKYAMERGDDLPRHPTPTKRSHKPASQPMPAPRNNDNTFEDYPYATAEDPQNKTGPSAAPRATSQYDEADNGRPQGGLTYVELDHGNAPVTNQIHQPDEETQYAQVSSVLV